MEMTIIMMGSRQNSCAQVKFTKLKAFVNDYRTDAVAAMFKVVLVKSGLYDSNHLGIDAEAITTPDTAPLLLCRRSDKVVVR